MNRAAPRTFRVRTAPAASCSRNTSTRATQCANRVHSRARAPVPRDRDAWVSHADPRGGRSSCTATHKIRRRARMSCSPVRDRFPTRPARSPPPTARRFPAPTPSPPDSAVLRRKRDAGRISDPPPRSPPAPSRSLSHARQRCCWSQRSHTAATHRATQSRSSSSDDSTDRREGRRPCFRAR